MKVLLVNPRTDLLIRSELPGHVGKELGHFPPLGLLYLAAYVRQGGRHQVQVLDMSARDVSLAGLADTVLSERPDLVGLTCITHNLASVKAAADVVKRAAPATRICIGGPHVRQFPEESMALDFVDFAVCGEGEVPFLELLDALQDGRSLDGMRSVGYKQDGRSLAATVPAVTTDIEGLPFPARDLVDRKDYFYILGNRATFATILSSRGCPFHCTFCATPHGAYRARSARSVVDEMVQCRDAGAEEIHFIDDTFNIRKSRLAEVSREILDRSVRLKWSFRGRADGVDDEGMALAARAGCTRFHVGVETGTDHGMEVLRKGVDVAQVRNAVRLARKHGIVSAAYFIIGCPHEKSRDDVLETIRFAVRLNPDFALFNILAIYPGTELFEEAVKKGMLAGDFWHGFARSPDPEFRIPLWEEHLDRFELERLLRTAYRRFYWRPGPILRNLRSVAGPGDLLRKAQAALSILLGRR